MSEVKEKKLWGTPLQLQNAKEKIVELEEVIAKLSDASGKPDVICEPSELQVMLEAENADLKRQIEIWSTATAGGMVSEPAPPASTMQMRDVWDGKLGKEGHQFVGNEAGEFGLRYRETIDFHNDSAFDNTPERTLALSKHGVEWLKLNKDKFPKFSKDSRIVVTIELLAGSPGTES